MRSTYVTEHEHYQATETPGASVVQWVELWTAGQQVEQSILHEGHANKIYLISPDYPLPSVALVQNRGLKHHSFHSFFTEAPLLSHTISTRHITTMPSTVDTKLKRTTLSLEKNT